VCTEINTLLAPLAVSLTRVVIDGIPEDQLSLLNGVSKLSHLSIYLSVSDLTGEHVNNFSIIRGAIHRSSDTVQSLKLDLLRWKSSSSPISDLFNGANFPRLATLHLQVCGEKLETTLQCTPPLPAHQLSSLKALHLTGILGWYPPEIPAGSEHIFTFLQRSGIHLVEINCGYICEPLLQYLLSYSQTLEVLKIADIGRARSKLAPSTDFNRALSQHGPSLRELTVRTDKDHGWAMGENNKDLLMVPLSALESLSVSVAVGDVQPLEKDDYLVSARLWMLINSLNMSVTRESV
jgi:hypothetical protein